MAALLPCTECDRFVRSSDRSCPFCGVALPQRSVKSGRRHVTRAAMVAVALAGGCAESSDPPAPLYGAPAVDAGEQEVDSGQDAGDDAELPAPLYGAPPADAGMTTDAGELPAPAYGGIPVDGG